MRIKNKKDFVLGVFGILFAALIIYMSAQLKASTYEGDPGPGLFPITGSVIMAVCGIALIIAPEKETGEFLTKAQWKAAGLLFCTYILLVAFLYILGFLPTVAIMLFIITFILSKLSSKDSTVKRRIIVSAVFGILGSAGIYLAYVVGLGSRMPGGLLWTLF